MTRAVFVTARSQPIPRWQEAFPDALLLCGQTPSAMKLDSLSVASVIWLHAGEDPNIAEWVDQLHSAFPAVPIVVLSNVPEDAQGMAVLGAGAAGYCSALTLPAVLQQVDGVVKQGGLWVGTSLMRRLMQGLATREATAPKPGLEQLSQREREVAEAAARGSTNKEIARVMNITERTVKAHLSAAYEKLGVRDRMQLSLVVNGVDPSTHPSQKISA